MSVTTGSKEHSILEIGWVMRPVHPTTAKVKCRLSNPVLGDHHQFPSTQLLKEKNSFCSRCSLYSKCASYESSQIRIFSLQNCLARTVVQTLIRKTAGI